MTSLPKLTALPTNLETVEMMRLVVEAHKAIAELKGLSDTMPDPLMLLSTLSLQEAKASSEIENIITTHDDLYQNNPNTEHFTSTAAKEVHSYAQAMFVGFHHVKNNGLLTTNTIIEIQQVLEQNNAGIRSQAGTKLKDSLGNVVYTPPQSYNEIVELMTDLERFINDDKYVELDDLIKLAIIHYQFESIHPFYDGNGRTGRIINILYLIKQGLINYPVLYLSRYINENRQDYYRLLNSVHKSSDGWNLWIIYILKGLAVTAKQTQFLITEIKKLMELFKDTIKVHNEKLYSHELISNLFKYPYTKIEFLADDLKVHKNTANRYLNELCDMGLLQKQRIRKEFFYINHQLFDLLQNNYHSH